MAVDTSTAFDAPPIRVPSGVEYHVDHREFGAKGDGVTDDTAAAQACLDAIETDGGGLARFRGGGANYLVTQITVPQGVYLQGGGLGQSAANRPTTITGTDTASDAIVFQSMASGIRDVWVQGPGSGTGTARGVVLDDGTGTVPTTSRFVMERVTVNQFPGAGIELAKPELYTLDMVTAQNCGGTGIYVHDDGLNIGISGFMKNVRGLDNLGTHQIHVVNQQHSVFINCQALAAGLGTISNTLFYIDGGFSNIVIAPDCEHGTDTTGLHIKSQGTQLIGGHFSNVATGIKFNNTRIFASGFRCTGSVTTKWETTSTAEVEIRNPLSAGNGSVASGGKQILVKDGLMTRWGYKEGSQLVTFADGDTTPSVANGNVFKTSNSSATTVTGFDDGSAGQVITVIFMDNNTTLDHSATLRLEGSVDWSPPAYSVINLVYDGSGWFETSRKTS